MLDPYQKLLDCQSLGFYNCCEITTIFLKCKEEKIPYNLFTIFVLDERAVIRKEKKYLTSKLEAISDKHSIGISQRVMSLNEIKRYYDILHESIEAKECIDIGDGTLKIGRLEEVPPMFVQQNSTKEVALNKVLKNNFRNGSYLIEFFDVEKPFLKLLRKMDIKKLCEVIYQYIPIDLLTISDRMGNFIFQFPSLNVDIHYRTDEREETLLYQIRMDERLPESAKYYLTAELMNDNTVVGFSAAEVQGAYTEQKLDVGDASRMCCTTLYDMRNQLIISKKEAIFMRHASICMHMSSEFGPQRLLYDSEGKIKDEVKVSSAETSTIGSPHILKRDKWIDSRKYRMHMDKLISNKEFFRYGRGEEFGREAAIKDIQNLMQRGGRVRVYLWDPYLTAEDLLETWYYTTTYGMELKAITSRNDADKTGENIVDWMKKQRKILEEGSNQYGINLELRCQWKGYGFRFHDRFLMIVSEEQSPIAWSLGASVNSLGKCHHIIQKVLHPQMVIDAFEELWDMLSEEECLIWKRGPGK